MSYSRPRMRDPGLTNEANVLIVDNDPGVTVILQHVLRLAGVTNIETAVDGAEGLERLESGGVTLVICDLDMPGISGEELVERVGDWDDPPPVIVVSAFLDQRIRERLAESPAFAGSFSKPFDILEFSNVIKERLAVRDESGPAREVEREAGGELF